MQFILALKIFTKYNILLRRSYTLIYSAMIYTNCQLLESLNYNDCKFQEGTKFKCLIVSFVDQ